MVVGSKPNFAHLPLLLVKGNAAGAQNLQTWLEKQFDCLITPLNLLPFDLIWMATEWAAPGEQAPDKAQRSLELVYNPPDTVPDLSRITYAALDRVLPRARIATKGARAHAVSRNSACGVWRVRACVRACGGGGGVYLCVAGGGGDEGPARPHCGVLPDIHLFGAATCGLA